ncbi:hypothetical protein PI126_g17528 [Phytophthora idaei]|nr:hypothetical protein PI126_g17528 [Phytophthora idaei]
MPQAPQDVLPTAAPPEQDSATKSRTTGVQKELEVQSANAVVRSARKAQQQLGKIGLQEGAIKEMRASMATYIRSTKRTFDTRATTTASTGPSPSISFGDKTEIVPATPDSQEDLTMEPTRTCDADGDTDLPTQMGQWLSSFTGREIEVEANGQCAFLALYATTMNHSAGKLKNTASTVKQATILKKAIYSLMMENLRTYVALGLVDPITECAKLYPDHPGYTSAEPAAAELYAHYDMVRARSAGVTVPTSFWAGPNEFRAMAQYLRGSVIVFDTNASKDALVQRYMYKTHRLADNIDYESGYGEPLTDRTLV